MKILTFVILSCSFLLVITCPEGSVQFSNSNLCYKFISAPTFFLEANQKCTNFGGRLAQVDSAFLDSFIYGQAKKEFGNGTDQKFWLGGSTIQLKGLWEWTNGSLLGYTNWAIGTVSGITLKNDLLGQPNITNPNNTSCLNKSLKDGRWNAESCFLPLPYVCQLPIFKETSTTLSPGVCRQGWTFYRQSNRCYKVKSLKSLVKSLWMSMGANSKFIGAFKLKFKPPSNLSRAKLIIFRLSTASTLLKQD